MGVEKRVPATLLEFLLVENQSHSVPAGSNTKAIVFQVPAILVRFLLSASQNDKSEVPARFLLSDSPN